MVKKNLVKAYFSTLVVAVSLVLLIVSLNSNPYISNGSADTSSAGHTGLRFGLMVDDSSTPTPSETPTPTLSPTPQPTDTPTPEPTAEPTQTQPQPNATAQPTNPQTTPPTPKPHQH